MSRPRKPFGSKQPGRLPSTMAKVLAAEMSDPHRLSRGKRYAKDGSVLDIDIRPGVVTCEVQGSRSTPYLASIEVTPGDGMPLRRDVSAGCTCPDADNWDGHICKHVVAALFAFADELLIEPELLDVWRGRDVQRESDAEVPSRIPANAPPSHADVWKAASETDEEQQPASEEAREEAPAAPLVDPLVEFLSTPVGRELPRVPHLERLDPDLPRPPDLAAVLRDALAHLRIEWE